MLKKKYWHILLLIIPCLFVNVSQAADAEGELLDRIIAVVNGDVITQNEFDIEIHKIKQQIRQQKRSVPDSDALNKQVLNRMVLMKIQLQRADLRHIRIDDDSLNRSIENMAGQNKLEVPELRAVLQQQGVEFEDFRESIRDQMTVARLQQREVTNRITVTAQEVEDFMKNRKVRGNSHIEFLIRHILISIPESATSAQIQASKSKAQKLLSQAKNGDDFAQLAITSSDGQQALKGGDLGWRKLVQIPSLFADVVTQLKVGEVSDIVRSPSGFHIIQLAEQRNNSAKRISRQVKARHILIKIDEENEDAVRTRITQLKQRIEDGEDFSALAKVHSDDKASGAQGGDLGWVSAGVMVPSFEKAMNALKVGELSSPVKTQFGWHIIEVLDHRDFDDTKAFERNQARDLIRNRKLEPALENWRRRLRDEAFVQLKL